jgi:subtilisin-like proprotein convertase family protein
MSKLIQNAPTATVGHEFTTTTEAYTSTFVGRGGNIPDGRGSFQDEIIVTDNFNITDVTVTLQDFVHTWVGDLVVRLRHLESGIVVDLFRRPGQPQFSSSGYSNDLKGNYSFNDRFDIDFEAAVGQHPVVPGGGYASLESLSAFQGLSATGTWQLTINDCSPGDSGAIGSWSLNLGWR